MSALAKNRSHQGFPRSGAKKVIRRCAFELALQKIVPRGSVAGRMDLPEAGEIVSGRSQQGNQAVGLTIRSAIATILIDHYKRIIQCCLIFFSPFFGADREYARFGFGSGFTGTGISARLHGSVCTSASFI